MGYTNPSWWVIIFFFVPKCHFLTIWWKNLTAAGVLRKYIKFDPPPQGKMLWYSNFRFFIKLINLDRCGNLIENLILLVLLGKL